MSTSWIRFVVLGAGAFGVVACTFASPTHLTYNAASEIVSAGPSTKTCDSPFVAPDLSMMQTCQPDKGKGHCYEATKVPTVGELAKCDDKAVCVPDTILEAAGKTKLKTCNSVINTPGACVSLLIQDIAKNAAQLTKDTCADDERCVPCVNPLDGTTTPFCGDIGVHEKDCTGADGVARKPQPCCLTKTGAPAGVCIDRIAVPEDQRDSVNQDVCAPSKACVPKSMVDGDPVHCHLAGALSGVCVDKCFAGAAANAESVSGGCGDGELCVPCLVGAGEGVVGCD